MSVIDAQADLPATAAPPRSVEVTGLTKRFGERAAVDDLRLTVRPSRVTGFVGPNGAGKTTTIRMLLGLIAPTAGTGEVLGHPLERPQEYLPRVGALIEGPAFYGGLSARRNLAILARAGGLPVGRIDEVLAKVELADRAQDAVKTYSLGMRQRLGIAAALLCDPELLVLDEPTNGLDPAGIRDVRALLRALADEGRSVLVSSHLLAELQEICDDIVLLRGGRLVFAGQMRDLLARQGEALHAAPEHQDDLGRLLEVARGLGDATLDDEQVVLTRAGAETSPAELNRAAHAAGITLARLERRRPTLEETFFAMTGDAEGLS